MTQYNWDNCPASVRTQIQAFVQYLSTLLADNLVGIYLHGSLAFGCFNPQRSDIDVLVVVRQPLPVEFKRQIINALLQRSNNPSPIEISFLLRSDLQTFEHPLFFDLHYSEMWREQNERELGEEGWRHWNDVRRRDSDLTAHLMIIHQCGITLFGKPASEVLPPVPAANFASYLRDIYSDDHDNWRENPVSSILNTCRIYAYLSAGHIFSKDDGGIYALKHLPARYHALIQQALTQYRGLGPATPFMEDAMMDFSTFLDRHILEEQDNL